MTSRTPTAPSAVLALTMSGALIGLAATRPSRWYVTGGFTNFLVMAQVRFIERVLESLLGVGASHCSSAS
jgi:hypothetical protein